MLPKLAVLCDGEGVLGEVQVHLQDGAVLGEELREIRISHYSPPSERCPPLAVILTVDTAGICFKLESPVERNQDTPLSLLHATCLRENKTAITSIGGREVHLVAMHSRKFEGQNPCFWGFNVVSDLYNSCLVMLNLRCLGIVFDLDETLIVANTMRSFEDKIEGLQRKINTESDPQRASGMLAEVKRYQEDKSILKQYAEGDQVIDNGIVINSQSEAVPALSGTHQPIVRPLVRLQDKNIILTRINPLIRDTSVLVRLRPAWEDLRSYLTARGRKRFEVFVCTMAERDYALEMWRLLDPESKLINPKEFSERIVCVKPGSRKSLFNVFQSGNCHPKMALVVDDRLNVWDEKDQPRVHVVPAFAPYYAPQAESNNTVPVLCVARNVACNVRGGFFKEFDDDMLQRVSEVAYEDDIKGAPSSPDVSHYLVSEDDPSALNGNKESLGFDGMADGEVERRLKEAMPTSSSSTLPNANLDPGIPSSLHYTIPSSSLAVPPRVIQGAAMSFSSQQLPQVTPLIKQMVAQLGHVETALHSSPGTEEGEVRESELDPDTRRRLLILQHGQDIREPSPSKPQLPARPHVQVSVPRVQPHGWFPVEKEMSPRQHNRVRPQEFPLNTESLPIGKNRGHHPHFLRKHDPSIHGRVALESQRFQKEALPREDQSRLNQSVPNFHYFSGGDGPIVQQSSANKDLNLEAGQIDPHNEMYTVALQDIAFKCGTKVEYRQSLSSSTELQFLVEVLFAGERVGEGIGRTRREAQLQAAEGSLLYLADKYLSQVRPDPRYEPGDGRAPPPNRILDPRMEISKRQMGPIAALKELCMMEGFGVAFQTQPQFSANPGPKNEVYAQVEVNGQVLGKGIGLTWDEAKSEAAEKALVALKSSLGQIPYRHQGSPRSMQGIASKRMKQESHRRMPSSGR